MLKNVFRCLLTLSLTMLLFVSFGCPQQNLTVEVTPLIATVELGNTQQFIAKVTPKNAVVTWSIDEGTSMGTISSNGLYTAPGFLPSPATATIRATCIADPTVSATAQVTIVSDTGTTTTTSVPGSTTTTALTTSTTTTTGGTIPDEPTIYLMTFNIGFDLDSLAVTLQKWRWKQFGRLRN